MMNNYGVGDGMWAGMWIFWIVIIVVVVLVIKILMSGSSGQIDKSKESPIQILDKRYARGEINQDEFESMKKELEK